jgi:hypothetical protein
LTIRGNMDVAISLTARYSGTRVDVPRKHARRVAFSSRKSHLKDHCKGTVTLVLL